MDNFYGNFKRITSFHNKITLSLLIKKQITENFYFEMTAYSLFFMIFEDLFFSLAPWDIPLHPKPTSFLFWMQEDKWMKDP